MHKMSSDEFCGFLLSCDYSPFTFRCRGKKVIAIKNKNLTDFIFDFSHYILSYNIVSRHGSTLDEIKEVLRTAIIKNDVIFFPETNWNDISDLTLYLRY